MANPRKPQHLKVVGGTDRPDRKPAPAVALQLVAVIPAPPRWMKNIYAKDEFKRLAKILHANKLLTEACLSPLRILCALHGEIVQLYGNKQTPSGYLIAQYRALGNDFGLTPVGQQKVRPNDQGKGRGGKFNGIGER